MCILVLLPIITATGNAKNIYALYILSLIDTDMPEYRTLSIVYSKESI